MLTKDQWNRVKELIEIIDKDREYIAKRRRGKNDPYPTATHHISIDKSHPQFL